MKSLDKLFKTVISFAQSVSKLTTVGRLTVIGALLFFVFSFKGCGSAPDVEKLKLEVQQTTNYANTLRDSVSQLQNVVSDKENKITVLKFEISMKQNSKEKLRANQTVLENKIIFETDTVTILALQDTTIDNLKSQLAIDDTLLNKKDQIISEKEAQVKLLQTGIVVSNIRGDSLQTALNTTLDKYNKKDKFFGFFPKPSRTVVAATALITGIYVGNQLTK
jgi:hypothetical protein